MSGFIDGCDALVTVPAGQSQDGLPLGFQVLGRQGDDLPTLQTAAWIETALR
ncbi:hypothetical protein PQR75_39860 [Paraburkholderia fungorum]|jgi:Asp-tRNA(Asn)/Glu-tRNA(Gln) amidotransferase A subunit family amidase|uniref:hypothetical protein n=1 Tax=Paraburkholderia fungorum TaxID=134537 RepID=UPI0038B9C1C4